MSTSRIGVVALAGLIGVAVAWAAPRNGSRQLTAEEIILKNVAARGGLEAWRKIRTAMWVGHIESGNPSAPLIPFVLEMKRPDKARFETRAGEQTSVHIFDGTRGWKMRGAAGGTPGVQPYTPEELRAARDAQTLDGPLIDHQAKGIAVALAGMDEVEGHKAYRLMVQLPSGSTRHVWIDAHTFLDLKYNREARAAGGQPGTVSVYYRNYRRIDGLQIPMTFEMGSGSGRPTQRMVIDTVTLNPLLPDQRFAGPGGPGALSAGPANPDGRPFPMSPHAPRRPLRLGGPVVPGPSGANADSSTPAR